MRNNRGSTQIALLIGVIGVFLAVIAITFGVTTPEIRQFFGLEKKSNTNAQNTPVVTEIKSEVGAEAQLKELEQLLQQGDFKAADEKTEEIIVSLESDSIEKFSCTDLRTIDQLWVNNSNGRFGFSVQKRLWQENGRDWQKLYEAIGWKKEGHFVEFRDLTFAKNAEKGHLPARGTVMMQKWSVVEERWYSFDVCKM